jgi:hypothetical protein
MAPACVLWRNGRGCSGASAALAATTAIAKRQTRMHLATFSDRYYITTFFPSRQPLLVQ